MLRKKLLSVMIAGVMFCSFSTSAFAELFSVSAGIPINFGFSDSDAEVDGTPSGLLLHAKLPIMVGFGYESYTVPVKSNVSTEVKYTLYDAFYLFPIPIINFTLGIGVGTVDYSTSGTSNYNSGMASQWYAQLGFPILGVADIHMSYHNVSAELAGKSGISDADVGGTMQAIGVSIGF
ncbi:MAG: hypothetical protein GY786_12630 [Proteobacteria bacterium]|nr:hypothetical protein [Pseudomonadota bacterium]